jgi:hypothetical protein
MAFPGANARPWMAGQAVRRAAIAKPGKARRRFL